MKNTVYVVNYIRTHKDGYTSSGVANICTSVLRAEAFIGAVVNDTPQYDVNGLPMYHDVVSNNCTTAYYTTENKLDDFSLVNRQIMFNTDGYGCGVTLDEDDEILEEPDLVFEEEDF